MSVDPNLSRAPSSHIDRRVTIVSLWPAHTVNVIVQGPMPSISMVQQPGLASQNETKSTEKAVKLSRVTVSFKDQQNILVYAYSNLLAREANRLSPHALILALAFRPQSVVDTSWQSLLKKTSLRSALCKTPLYPCQ